MIIINIINIVNIIDMIIINLINIIILISIINPQVPDAPIKPSAPPTQHAVNLTLGTTHAVALITLHVVQMGCTVVLVDTHVIWCQNSVSRLGSPIFLM